MSLAMILIIILVALLVFSAPTWPHSAGWGLAPAGGIGVVLLIVLILILAGRL